MLEGICVLPIIPMRANKSDKSEMINQIIFGERFQIIEKKEKKRKVVLHHDKYCGWVDNKQYQLIPQIQTEFQISNKKYTNIRIISGGINSSSCLQSIQSAIKNFLSLCLPSATTPFSSANKFGTVPA